MPVNTYSVYAFESITEISATIVVEETYVNVIRFCQVSGMEFRETITRTIAARLFITLLQSDCIILRN